MDSDFTFLRVPKMLNDDSDLSFPSHPSPWMTKVAWQDRGRGMMELGW